MWKSKCGITIVLMFSAVAFVIAVSSIVLAESPEEAKQKAKAVTVVGSEIKATGEHSCDDGKEAIQKVLVFKSGTEGGDIEELETSRWWEATDKSCEPDGKAQGPKTSLPEPSEELKRQLKEDAEMRAKKGVKAAGQAAFILRPACSGNCFWVQPWRECHWGNMYLVEYCVNECNQYTGRSWVVSWLGYC